MSTTLGDKLKLCRTMKGVSQEQMGMDLKMDQSTISRWELGLRRPAQNELQQVAEYFGVEEEDLSSNSDVTLHFDSSTNARGVVNVKHYSELSAENLQSMFKEIKELLLAVLKEQQG